MARRKIESTAPWSRSAWNIDEEVTKLTLEYLEKAKKATTLLTCGGTPPACTVTPPQEKRRRARPAWVSTATACRTRRHVGQRLDKLKDWASKRKTIVMYSTINVRRRQIGPTAATRLPR